jgi:hypothetical protein
MEVRFSPPQAARKAARAGLKLRKIYGRGGTRVGMARAHQLDRGEALPLKTVKRMKSFFARHEQNKDSVNKKGEPGNGMIAWLLWGGDAGQDWSQEVVKWTEKEGING